MMGAKISDKLRIFLGALLDELAGNAELVAQLSQANSPS